MSSNNYLLSQKLDDIIPILGIISSILLIFVCMSFNRMIYLLPGILSLIACMIWFGMRKKAFYNQYTHLSFSTGIILNSLYFIFFSLSILSIYFRPDLYERPLLYFILMSLIVGIMALRIFCNNISNSLFIFQTILIGISISWSQLFIFPSLVGVDPWYHQAFTSKILDTYFIPDGYSYSKLPLFHILITLTSLVTGLDYKFATMFSVSLSQIICNVLFIFLLGKFLFNNRIGLLASLLLVVADHHIFMSYWSIPNSFAAIFIIPIFYLSFMKKKFRLTSSILTILLMVCLIFTHTITALCMPILIFVFLLSFNFSPYFPKYKSPISSTYFSLFVVTMFAWWSFASGHIRTIGRLIKWGFSLDTFSRTPLDIPIEYFPKVSFYEQLFNNVGMFLFFSLSFIGFFYMISKRYGNLNLFAIAFISITPLVLGFLTLITQHSIIQDRWWYFAQILLSLPLALSFYLMSSYMKKNSFKILLPLVILMSFSMIMSPCANTDNLLFSPNSNMRYSLTTSEIQAINTNSNFFNGTIKADEYYANSQRYSFNVDSFSNDLYKSDFNQLKGNLVLVREYIIERPFKLYSSLCVLDYDVKDQLNSSKFSKTYDSTSVEGYLYLSLNDQKEL